jgi:hypothetical protein
MICLRTVARQGVYVAAIAVVASILSDEVWHGWQSLAQPNFWVVKAIAFALTIMSATAFFALGFWRD